MEKYARKFTRPRAQGSRKLRKRLEHKGYMVVEADSFEQIDAAFDPVLEMGHFEVTPVMQR